MTPHSCLQGHRARTGALLLEILLSIVIMSVSLGVIIGAMTSSMRSARFAAQYTQAVIEADARMARHIKEERFAGAMPVEADPEEVAEKEARYDFTIEAEGSQESEDIKLLRLVTQWKSGRKSNRLTLTTYSRTAP